jgi:hypothetical protein
MKQFNLRYKILDLLKTMHSKCDGDGFNPFTVNVVTFSGHGITFDGDAIAAIPEYLEEQKTDVNQEKVLRFINFSDWARRFAQIKNTLTIFILSMCRIEVEKSVKEKVYAVDE